MNAQEIRLKIAEMKGLTNVYIGNIPNWPEVIADADFLLDEVQSAGDGYELSNIVYYETKVWLQECVIYSPIGGGDISKKFTAKAETRAMAISTAWIAWKESQK